MTKFSVILYQLCTQAIFNMRQYLYKKFYEPIVLKPVYQLGNYTSTSAHTHQCTHPPLHTHTTPHTHQCTHPPLHTLTSAHTHHCTHSPVHTPTTAHTHPAPIFILVPIAVHMPMLRAVFHHVPAIQKPAFIYNPSLLLYTLMFENTTYKTYFLKNHILPKKGDDLILISLGRCSSFSTNTKRPKSLCWLQLQTTTTHCKLLTITHVNPLKSKKYHNENG